MKLAHSFSFLVLVSIMIAACKKEENEEPVTNDPPATPLNIAPCELNEEYFSNDSVSTYSSFNFYPEASYCVTFYDTTNALQPDNRLEFAFLNYPETGTYYLVYSFDTDPNAHPNQIAHARQLGSDMYRSISWYDSIIYVEKNDQELIISYCAMPYEMYQYNPNTDCYEGYGYGFRKYRKAF